MTNEKLGVLLVDVPEPIHWEYTFLAKPLGSFTIRESNKLFDVLIYGHRCTKKEAKKYKQFKWVALEDL